jgi:hypothetical protein
MNNIGYKSIDSSNYNTTINTKKVNTKNDLPQICKDTYTEVMKKFDKLQNKTTDTN